MDPKPHGCEESRNDYQANDRLTQAAQAKGPPQIRTDVRRTNAQSLPRNTVASANQQQHSNHDGEPEAKLH